MIDFLRSSFNIPIVVPELKYGCSLYDNTRFFKNAVGFISPHGASFANLNFIRKQSIVIQFIPRPPHPFEGPAVSLRWMVWSYVSTDIFIFFILTFTILFILNFHSFDNRNTKAINLGHLCYNVPCVSSREPRWDLNYQSELLLHHFCNAQKGYIREAFSSWEPSINGHKKCYDYIKKMGFLKSDQKNNTTQNHAHIISPTK